MEATFSANNIMASSTDEDGIEEFVQDVVLNRKVESRDLKSGSLLGKGSSSIVYETTWEGKSYARKDFLRVPSGIFEREAAVLVGLDHPNVVRTYCWTVNEGSCSLVLELMDDDLLNTMQKRKDLQRKKFPSSGPSDASQTSHLIDLHKFIEDGKNAPVGTASESVASTLVYRFSMPEALQIMMQIAEGIEFLHDNGVAHGDLKPKNILVTPSGRAISDSLDQNVAFKIKVADFGLVRTKMKSKTLVSRQARKLEMVRWRAPELLDMGLLREEEHESFTDSDWDSDSSDEKIGVRIHKLTYGNLARADVYSFALTCSHLLTGEDPYPGLGLNDLVRRIPLGLRPGLPRRCPAQLSDLINRCWGEEVKRPSFYGILNELKDLQASLTADSRVDIRKTIITGPSFELTVSLKYVTENFAKNQSSEKPGGSSNPTVRGSEINEKVDLPIGHQKHLIKASQESSKGTFVSKKRRRRRKVYSCLGNLGCMPAKAISSKENEDIPTPTKRSSWLKPRAADAQNKKNPFGKPTSKPFSRNDKRYNAEIGRTIGATSFTLAEVTAMTRNYKTEIGKGGFGPVYYGKLPDGQEVAVKVGSSPQGQQEFFNEINVLSRVRHKNLVALVGYCQEDKQHILIYEYMKNGSLHDHLFGNTQSAGKLDWKMRLRIALNVAQGLEYLHTGCEQSFVHRDVKSSNILLSAKYDAKVTDFGVSKLMGEVEEVSHVTSFVKGTAGYLDPEYFGTNQLSTKSDIYSFGVVLLELITGHPPNYRSSSFKNDHNLRSWVGAALQEDNIDMVLDPAVKSSRPVPKQDALWKVAEIAMQCVEPKGIHRPKMTAVIQELHHAMNLEEGMEEPLEEPLSFASIYSDPWVDIKKNTIKRTESLETWVSPYSAKNQTESVIKSSSSEDSAINQAELVSKGWSFEYSAKNQSSQKPVWGSPSTNSSKETFVIKKQRRPKAYSCLERLGCIPTKAVSGKENEDIPTPTLSSHEDIQSSTKRSSWLNRRAEKRRAEDAQKIGRYIGAKSFTLAEVTAMTTNFKTVIGKGGFGPVYYGKLPDGQEVAVKVGNAYKGQGQQEFFNEIDILSRVRHKNLVALVGYCEEDKQHILIYEYMKNGSLHDHLFGNTQSAGKLDWKMRLRIALNVAQGLEYLHTGCHPKLIHRDVKSNNILLSAKYDAKVTDFGLSKLMGEAEVLTMVMGTRGYLDPEYIETQFLSAKSDIYSFGVVLLELITGCPPIIPSVLSTRHRNLCAWVRAALQEGNFDMVLDPAVISSRPVPKQDALWKVAEIAMQCVEPRGKHRPTMTAVIQELHHAMKLEEGIEEPMEEPLEGSLEPSIMFASDY